MCTHVRVSSVAQSYLTLCNLMACDPPGSSVHGIFQASILEQVAISSRGELLDPGIELASPTLAVRFFATKSPGKCVYTHTHVRISDIYGHFTVHSLNSL